MKVAVFDVCGTLYSANTTFDFLDIQLKENTSYFYFRRASQILIGKIFGHLYSRAFKVDLIRAIATRYLRGIDVRDLDLAAKKYVASELEGKCKHDVLDILSTYRDRGFKIILMSGSYSLIVKHVCARFKADGYFASELEVVNSKLTGKYKFDQLLTKKRIFLEQFPYVSELVVISDNRSDADLMAMAQKGYAICNKPKQIKFWQSMGLDHVVIIS